ncbi:MAG: hypothetical protein QY307_03265 [Acidimicrobiia bacterium]|nr:MAG: hypothetical protein QY307_03265 [Acidimicrobiia bacterium]
MNITDLRWLIAAAVVGVITLGVVVMSSGGGDPVAADSTTTTVESTTTSGPVTTSTEAATTTGPTVATTTTTEAATTTTVAATTTVTTAAPNPWAGCAALAAEPLAEGALVAGGPGNFDGDPQPLSIMEADGAILYLSGGQYRLGFALFPNDMISTPLAAPSAPAFPPEFVGVIDFGPANDGVLIRTEKSLLSGHDVYAFYYLTTSCTVEVAHLPGDPPLEFLHGFGAAHREGLTCAADGVYETSAGATGGTLWDVRSRFYQWDPAGTGFQFGFEDGFEAAPDSADALAAGAFNC